METAYVRLFFPSITQRGNPIHSRGLKLRALMHELIDVTGGFTKYEARGGYRMADGTHASEAVDVLEFWSLPEYARATAARLAAELDQESLLVNIDGQPEFISAVSVAESETAPAAEAASY